MTAVRMPPLALLAGGTATRLRPITEKIAKSMVDIDGTPFIDHQLRLLARRGVEKVTICCGVLHEQIENFVGDGSRFGIAVNYSRDGGRPLGTGGALLKALPLLGDEFFVLYGDSYLDVAFHPILDVFRKSGSPGLMTVLRNNDQWDASNVYYKDGKIITYDKTRRMPEMQHVDFGLGCLRASAFEGRREGADFDLAEIYQELIRYSSLAAYEVMNRFYEIGSHRGLAETIEYLAKQGRAGTREHNHNKPADPS